MPKILREDTLTYVLLRVRWQYKSRFGSKFPDQQIIYEIYQINVCIFLRFPPICYQISIGDRQISLLLDPS